MMMAKYVAFSLLFFFDENIYIPKKKKQYSLLFAPIIDISSDRSKDEGVWRCRTDTLSVSHAVIQMDHFLSYDLATYLNCFLIAFPSISTNLKVFVAEVESPRHLVGFHRPGAFQTVFRLGALTFSTDFLTASRRAKSAE